MLIRSLAFGLAVAVALPALAEDTGTTGRYGIAPADDGFVRLDSETGQTSYCSKQDGVWQCEPLDTPDEELEARVDDLSDSLDTLGQRVEDLSDEVGELAARTADTAGEAVDETADFADTVVGRFKTMVRDMKRSTGWDL